MTDIRKKLAGKATKLAQERPKQDDHPAATMNDCREGSYYQLDINLILGDPALPEQEHDPAGLAELADSIRQTRLYQPVVVRKDAEGRILLVTGSRLLMAAKMAGLEKIPAIFTEADPREVSQMENLYRENFKPREEVAVSPSLQEQHVDAEEKPATDIGQTPAAISTTIPIPPAVAVPDDCRESDDVERFEEYRKSQLLTELHRLVTIIDGLITDGK